MSEERKDFCIECRRDTEYTFQKVEILKTIRGKEYKFYITSALCDECGAEMSLPGLIDRNVQEIDEQYRKYEQLVSIDDIEKLMKLYKIGKAPLSLSLGFGEITITRYISGQIPSKEYSEIIKKALCSPLFMQEKLRENRDKINPVAFAKAMNAAIHLKNLFTVSNKMLGAIDYIFKNLEEVTHLMLQKLLYFTQGISYALNNKPIFSEDCRAWVHGPVYPEVYDMFRDFKYNPIEDSRFAILDGTNDVLTEEERRVIDVVINTFGVYGGKVLERITHNEDPWKKARKGYGKDVLSNELIPKESIEAYYIGCNKHYDFSVESNLQKYIREILKIQ